MSYTKDPKQSTEEQTLLALEYLIGVSDITIQAPLVTRTMTGVLADDKIALPANCVKVIFKVTAAAYVVGADATPVSLSGVEFPPGIPFGLNVKGRTYLYGEAAAGDLQAIAFCTD